MRYNLTEGLRWPSLFTFLVLRVNYLPAAAGLICINHRPSTFKQRLIANRHGEVRQLWKGGEMGGDVSGLGKIDRMSR